MAKKVYSIIFVLTFYIFISFTGSSILQTVQQSVDEASKSEGQQCILLGIVEQGKIPEGISFSNEIEIKVGANFMFSDFPHLLFRH